jgi:hypothetical protein
LSNLSEGISKVGSVELKVGWYTEGIDEAGLRQLIPTSKSDLFGDIASFPVLEIKTANRTRRIKLDSTRSFLRRSSFESMDLQRFPCIYVDPLSSGSTSTLGALWDAIALTKVEKSIVQALQIISEDIEDVSMIGSESSSRSRTAIVKSSRFRAPVPLRSFGDGLNRIFGIILSLVNATGGVLLVDEIENGLHYSVLNDVWKVIFKMAQELDVQVFATSHSWECIDAFQKAANAHPSDGVLVRLARHGDDIIPTIFSEYELEIAAREDIEVR